MPENPGYIPISAASISGNTITLSLGVPILSTDAPKVYYYQSGQPGDLLAADGETLVDEFYGYPVTNTLAYSPVYSASVIDSKHIVLTMLDALTGTEGDPAAFTVGGIASNPTVDSVYVNDKYVTLALSAAIASTDSPTVSYTATGTNDLTTNVTR
jgi:hypothetical protein